MLTKHPPIRAVIVTAVAALSLVFAPAALAGKPSGGGGGGKPHGGGGTTGSGTISPVFLDSTDGVPHYGQRVRFNLTTSTAEPWVTLKCYQGGTLVAQGQEGYFARSLDDGVFGLYSGAWAGGDADCTATLSGNDWAPIASTSFHVYA